MMPGTMETLFRHVPDAAARDLANIACGQMAAHFCLAACGTLRSYAELAGNRTAAALPGKTLDETSAIDAAFTRLAQRLTRQADSPGGGEARVRTAAATRRGVLAVAGLAALAVAGGTQARA